MPTHKTFTEDDKNWWNPNGPFWTLHAINPIRLSFILNHIQSGLALDVGCGGGILTEKLSDHFTSYGIDIDNNLIDIAKAREHKCHYYHANSNEFANQYTEHFDLITCLEVLEHTKDPRSIIANMVKMLKPQGCLILSTLNRNLLSFITAIVIAEHLIKIIPKNTHQYEYFITPNELISYAYDHDLALKDIQGIGYNPLSKSFYITHNTSINYIACFVKK